MYLENYKMYAEIRRTWHFYCERNVCVRTRRWFWLKKKKSLVSRSDISNAVDRKIPFFSLATFDSILQISPNDLSSISFTFSLSLCLYILTGDIYDERERERENRPNIPPYGISRPRYGGWALNLPRAHDLWPLSSIYLEEIDYSGTREREACEPARLEGLMY